MRHIPDTNNQSSAPPSVTRHSLNPRRSVAILIACGVGYASLHAAIWAFERKASRRPIAEPAPSSAAADTIERPPPISQRLVVSGLTAEQIRSLGQSMVTHFSWARIP
jgi:hypothetical protein